MLVYKHVAVPRRMLLYIEVALFGEKYFLNDGTPLTQNRRKWTFFVLHDSRCVHRPWDFSYPVTVLLFSKSVLGRS